jgi:5-methylthioribose kinase
VSSAPAYLERRTGQKPERVSELSGGVSNTVLLVENGSHRFVLKQSLPQLRVKEEWLSDRRRILRECAALRTVAPLLPAGSAPEVLFEDPENLAFAMTAAPPEAVTWKSQLLAGQLDLQIAETIGALLGKLIETTWKSPQADAEFGDLTIFEELRLSPYYGFLAQRHPDLAPEIDSLADDCRNRRFCLVHGDFSPKNFLVHGPQVIAIDWECIHFGNPAFDSAFLLNHLLLKSFCMPERADDFASLGRSFWNGLKAAMPDAPWFESATIGQWGGLLLARIDGKSPAEYIGDETLKQTIRQFARELVTDPPATVAQVFERRAECR